MTEVTGRGDIDSANSLDVQPGTTDKEESMRAPIHRNPRRIPWGTAFLFVSYINAGQQVDIETRTLLPQISWSCSCLGELNDDFDVFRLPL